MNLTLKALRSFNKIRNDEFAKKMDTSQWTLIYRTNELAGEVGEACNIAKKIKQAELGLPTDATKDDLARELADIIISCDLVAMDAGIDLNKWVPKKFNETSDKHGLTTKIGEG